MPDTKPRHQYYYYRPAVLASFIPTKMHPVTRRRLIIGIIVRALWGVVGFCTVTVGAAVAGTLRDAIASILLFLYKALQRQLPDPLPVNKFHLLQSLTAFFDSSALPRRITMSRLFNRVTRLLGMPMLCLEALRWKGSLGPSP
jgi:hypothetical protein